VGEEGIESCVYVAAGRANGPAPQVEQAINYLEDGIRPQKKGKRFAVAGVGSSFAGGGTATQQSYSLRATCPS